MSVMEIVLGWDWSAIGNLLSGDLAREITEHATAIAQETVKLAGKEGAKESGKLIATMAAKEAAEKTRDLWGRIRWGKAEKGYAGRLYEHVNTTRLLGNPKPVKIDALYTDVFVYEKLSAFRRSQISLKEPGRDPYTLDEPYERSNALELVERGEHLYILGHPGAGKTTFLKFLTLLACEGKIPRTPIYVPLREVMQLNLTVSQYIEREFDICGFPDAKKFVERLLDSSDTLLLVDGLDEVQDIESRRTYIILEITELARRHPRSQLVVTCRIAASDYTFQQFTYCEVAQFTSEQQKTFIRKWYSTEASQSSRLLAEWDEPRIAPLRDLAKTPLLLALICLAFDDLGELPERHVDLYREAIDALLKRWDSSRNIRRDPFYAGLSPHRREQLFQELASKFHDDKRILFSASDAAPIVSKWFDKLPDPPKHETGAVPDLLEQIEAQHGLVVQRASGIYSFSHLSLQEFFAARAIAQGHPFKTVDRIAQLHVTDPRWREVFIFLAGLLPDGTALLERLRGVVGRVGADDPVVRNFISHVIAEYARREAAWRLNGNRAGERRPIAYSGKSPALRMLDILRRRVEAVRWIVEGSGLRLKVEIAEEILIAAEAGADKLNAAAVDSVALTTYLQAAVLAIDCTSVAMCENRERAVGWILTALRS